MDLDAFYNPSCTGRLSHLSVYLLTVKSFAVYVADLWTAGILKPSRHVTRLTRLFLVSLLIIGQTTTTPAIPTEISKWLFFACIMFSFLVLIWDMFKAYRILKSRDISYAFTSVIANRYLSMKDYRIFCLFKSINATSKGIDSYAFFVFFQLKGWKRLLIAEAPRQVINVVTLEALAPDWLKIRDGSISFDNEVLGKDTLQQILTITMAFSVLVFAISFFLVCVALVLYIPLLCHIRGNLKEYCCHKVDKRINEILLKQRNQRKPRNPAIPDSEVFLEKDIYNQRPLGVKSPSFNSSGFSSPSLNSSGYSSPAFMSTTLQKNESEQRLLSHEELGYFPRVDQQYFPRPVAQQQQFAPQPQYGYSQHLDPNYRNRPI